GNRGIVRIGKRLVAVRGRHVDDVRPRIDFGLGYGVSGRVGPGLTDFQQGIVIARDVGNPRQVADERIDDRDTGQRLVTRVLDAERVADDFTGEVGRTATDRGILHNIQSRTLRDGNRGVIRIGSRLVAIGGRHVDDVRPRIDLGLGYGVGSRVGPSLTHFQQGIVVARAVGDPGQVAGEWIDDR